jgi:hypothetical protein
MEKLSTQNKRTSAAWISLKFGEVTEAHPIALFGGFFKTNIL